MSGDFTISHVKFSHLRTTVRLSELVVDVVKFGVTGVPTRSAFRRTRRVRDVVERTKKMPKSVHSRAIEAMFAAVGLIILAQPIE